MTGVASVVQTGADARVDPPSIGPDPFTYQALPMRVVFGVGAVSSLPDEVARLGLERVLVLCSPGQEDTAEYVSAALADRSAGIMAKAVMHVPVEVTHEARQRVAQVGADGCVAVGGGSAVGLGKAIALQHDLPVIAVPTTYAGSEMTPVWGITADGRKTTGRSLRVLPCTVVYDPTLTVSLPVALSVTSGINAIAHAVEGLYAPDATPIVSLMAQEGVRSLAAALPGVVADGTNLPARSAALYGAWLCGAVLAATTMSLHHKLCHVLGGTLNLPHAQTHTVVLPHALAYNAAAAPGAVAALSRALDTGDPTRQIWDLAGRLGAPRSLRELGMASDDIAGIVEQVIANPYANPRPVTREGLTALLQAAWAGSPPQA